jgi:hypothetical protein
MSLHFPLLPSTPDQTKLANPAERNSCWDGKNLDTPNHQDHVAYPVSGPADFLSLGGNCPSTHPVRIPQLMYEVVWDTTGFNNKAEWPADGSQPFVLSTGDATGLGQHGDYVFVWKDDSLQRAMDTSGCFGAQCASLRTQSIDTARSCAVKQAAKEDYNKCKSFFWCPSSPCAVPRNGLRHLPWFKVCGADMW